MVDHIVIKYLIFLVLFIVLAAFEEDVLDLFPPFCLAAVEVVQSALDEELVEVHFEGSALEDVLHSERGTS